MVLEPSTGLMEGNTMEDGRTANNMAEDNTTSVRERRKLESGWKVRK